MRERIVTSNLNLKSWNLKTKAVPISHCIWRMNVKSSRLILASTKTFFHVSFSKRTTCRHLRMGIRSHITGLPFQRPLLDTTADGYVYLRHDSLNLFLNHRTKEGVRESRPCFLLGSYPSHLREMKISSVFQDF